MKKFLPLFIFWLTVFAVAVQAQDFQSSLKTAYDTGSKASWLAGAHAKLKVDCEGCHGPKAFVDDNETTVNASCVSCHGTQEKMAQRTKHEINAHESHFGQMSCTSCHRGHETSFSYCNNCHSFDETIPFNGPKKTYEVENFDAYDHDRPIRIENTDVVVIGSGGTGSTAALVARESGAAVVVLEKMPVAGGNTLLGAGSMNAANTRFQRAREIKDSTDLMVSDTLKGGKNINDPALVKVLAEESAASIDWLDKHGVRLDYFIGIGGGASVVRGHSPDGGKPVGAFILKGLKPALVKAGVDVRLNSYVVKILADDKGAATGVLVKGKHSGLYQINAKAVIIAAGGFGANKAMVVKYRPDALPMSTSNQPGATGDSIALGTRVGAALVDVEQIQIHPSIAVGSQILISEKTRGVGAVLVNLEGHRFFNELLTRDKVSAAILAQPSSKAYLVFDDGMRGSMSMLKGYTTLGLVLEDDTLEGLAKKMGVDAARFVKTIGDYNDAVKNQKDAFGRTDLKRDIKTPKYCAILISPGVHYTMGGLKINTKAQVLDKNGKAIPRLFAGGEATGGVHGANRLGGNSISETITFGRIAGQSAADLVKAQKP